MSSEPEPARNEIAIYHNMFVSENFEQCAARLFQTVAYTQRIHPGSERLVFLDIEGHRNDAGGYDHDAFEIMSEFALGFLLPYVTEISTPLLRVRNTEPQNDEIPEFLVIGSQPRTRPPVAPKSKRGRVPTVDQIAERLGLPEPKCLVCGSDYVERAHIVPHALGGTSELSNLALLCPHHHREAPDVAVHMRSGPGSTRPTAAGTMACSLSLRTW